MTQDSFTSTSRSRNGEDSTPPEPARDRAVTSRWPRHETDEIEAATRVLRSGRVNSLVHGEENKAFSGEFASFVGARHGICVANGTVALETGLRALGIGADDEVIVPARSFFASASCVIAAGASPVFCDVLADSQNIDPASVERMISPMTRAIICVHLAGWPCELVSLREICDRHGLFLVEDCAQAHGATFAGQTVGSVGDVAAFSFCTDKIMSTGGEGGMLLASDDLHWERAWAYKDHGKSLSRLSAAPGSPGEFRYLHDTPGSNFRMTEMQAAIGRCQLKKLPSWLAARRRNAEVLTRRLRDHPLILVPRPGDCIGHAWYKYYVQLAVDEADVEARRATVISHLQSLGIPCGTGSCPDMSQEAALDGLPIRRDGDLTEARRLGKRTLMFPVDHTLQADDMDRIADALLEAMAS